MMPRLTELKPAMDAGSTFGELLSKKTSLVNVSTLDFAKFSLGFRMERLCMGFIFRDTMMEPSRQVAASPCRRCARKKPAPVWKSLIAVGETNLSTPRRWKTTRRETHEIRRQRRRPPKAGSAGGTS